MAKTKIEVNLANRKCDSKKWDRIRGMIVLIVLVISLLVFRAAGALGVGPLNSWPAATRWALVVMFALTASAHFNRMRHELAAMVPKALGNGMAWVYFTGVCEIVGAIGILLPRFRIAAGLCLIALLVAMFPANVKAARERLHLAGKPATALRLRLPMQMVFIGLLWWATRA
jgi:uncharacterized membrane protein